MDKRVRLRKDFYRNAAGDLLERSEIPVGKPEINAVTELSIGSDEHYDVPNALLTGGR